MNSRRKFLLYSALLMSSSLLSSKIKQNTLSMKGDLDDDLFIIKSNNNGNTLTHCLQMHNPKNFFAYEGNAVKSTQIYGVIDFKEKISIKSDEVFCVCVANEREEIYDLPKLRERSHFKAVDFFVDNKILIPSLMPEKNDVPNYPVWFGNENQPCSIDEKDKVVGYNYYKLWENAVCGVGLIFPKTGKVEIQLYNENGDRLFSFNEIVTNKPKQLISEQVKYDDFEAHVLAEIDGFVYSENSNTDDEFIKKNAIVNAVISFDKETIQVTLPYPLPYPNRIYAIAV